MPSYKTAQYRLVHRGREFHFVSYEGRSANTRTGAEATPAVWCLMRAGKRWPVMPHVSGQDPGREALGLTRWLDRHVFGGGAAAGAPEPV